MKRILFITHLSGKRVNRLWMSSIIAAKELGLEFHLACNMAQIEQPGWDEDCKKYGIVTHQIDFNRNPLNKENKRAYGQLLQLMQKIQFDIIHCNTPIGGVLGRLCAKKINNRHVIYQAHGFHFWKGAPIKNWMIYYPVEKYLARYTDTLITINEEDYNVAQKFKVRGNACYVHGVGVDVAGISNTEIDASEKRKQLEIPDGAYVFITVGELIPRKNQEILIDAFRDAKIKNSYLLICGCGQDEQRLKDKIINCELTEQIKMLGFRKDIKELLKMSDCFVFPSLQEGLPVALMEAMASGLPCAVANIRGNVDLVGNQYKYMFNPSDAVEMTNKIKKIIRDKKIGNYCKEMVMPFEFNAVVEELKEIYLSIRRRG